MGLGDPRSPRIEQRKSGWAMKSHSNPCRQRLPGRIAKGRLWHMLALAADEYFNNDISRGLL